jgi:integrase/recombinase XerC
MPLSEIGYVELDRYQRWVEEKFAKSTAKKKITMIRSLLLFGYEHQFFDHDMRKYIRLPKRDKTRARVDRQLTYEEAQRLLDEVRGHKLNHVIVAFLFFTGLRVSELCQLRWGDIQKSLFGASHTGRRRKRKKAKEHSATKGFVWIVIRTPELLRSIPHTRGKCRRAINRKWE